jgi:hypothetical protein
MSPFAWIICLCAFSTLFWLVLRQKKRGGGNARQAAEARTAMENNELRHVVMEMALERHLLHTGGHHGDPLRANRRHGR